MKVILEYNKSSAEIKDANGVVVGTWFDLQHYGEAPESDKESMGLSIGEIIKMKDAGLTVDEIIQLNKNALI